MLADEYNAAQQEVVSLLGAPRQTWPEFQPELRDELRNELEDRLGPLSEAIDSPAFGDSRLFLSKFALAQTLACERKFMAENSQPFSWSPPTARGAVAHKAIELSVHWQGTPHPLDLVQEAIASLAERDAGLADYLQTCGEADLAEVRAEANRSVSHFLECFPPLKSAWKPVAESRMRAELCGGRIVLSGKADLTLGQPEGTRAGKVIIDLKTGGFSPVHREDLRFYALLESMRTVPAPAAGHLLPRPGPAAPRGRHRRCAPVRAGAGRRRGRSATWSWSAEPESPALPPARTAAGARCSSTATRAPSTWRAAPTAASTTGERLVLCPETFVGVVSESRCDSCGPTTHFSPEIPNSGVRQGWGVSG